MASSSSTPPSMPPAAANPPRSRRWFRPALLITAGIALCGGAGAGLALRLMPAEDAGNPRENRFNLQVGNEQSFPPSDHWPEAEGIEPDQRLDVENTVVETEPQGGFDAPRRSGTSSSTATLELTNDDAEKSAFPDPVLPESAASDRPKAPPPAPASPPSSPLESATTDFPTLDSLEESAPPPAIAPPQPELAPLPAAPAPPPPAAPVELAPPPPSAAVEAAKPSAEKAVTPAAAPPAVDNE